MKKRLLLSLGLVIAVSSPIARANTIHSGNYTVDISNTGGMAAHTGGNSIGFTHERVNGFAPGTGGGSVSASGSLVATFTADPGLIFDKFYFGGLTGGMTAIERGGATARINWQVNGGTFSGPQTYNGFHDASFAREWQITGPNTGTSYLYGGYWFSTVTYDFNDPILGSGYYEIGASSFSINLASSIFVTDTGYWSSFIVPHAVQFRATFLDAPPPGSPVPETGATVGLLLLGFSGVMALRRSTCQVRCLG